MVSSVLCITSQAEPRVEHTKKRNNIDSESKSVKQHRSLESFNSGFLHVTLVLPYGKNVFDLNTESALAGRAD